MQKYLSVTATGEQTQLVPCSQVLLVEQASTTTVTVTYASGSIGTDVITITHAALGAGIETMRDWFQNNMVAAMQTHWTQVSFTPTTAPAEITGIAIT